MKPTKRMDNSEILKDLKFLKQTCKLGLFQGCRNDYDRGWNKAFNLVINELDKLIKKHSSQEPLNIKEGQLYEVKGKTLLLIEIKAIFNDQIAFELLQNNNLDPVPEYRFQIKSSEWFQDLYSEGKLKETNRE